MTVLVLDLTGVLHRGTGFRWQATGVLIEITAMDASGSAALHHWSGTLESTTVPVMLAGFATFIVGLVIQTRNAGGGSSRVARASRVPERGGNYRHRTVPRRRGNRP